MKIFFCFFGLLRLLYSFFLLVFSLTRLANEIGSQTCAVLLLLISMFIRHCSHNIGMLLQPLYLCVSLLFWYMIFCNMNILAGILNLRRKSVYDPTELLSNEKALYNYILQKLNEFPQITLQISSLGKWFRNQNQVQRSFWLWFVLWNFKVCVILFNYFFRFIACFLWNAHVNGIFGDEISE